MALFFTGMAFNERDTVHLHKGATVALATILRSYNGMQSGPIMNKHDFALRFFVAGNDSISPPLRLAFEFASIAVIELKRHLHFQLFDRVSCAGD